MDVATHLELVWKTGLDSSIEITNKAKQASERECVYIVVSNGMRVCERECACVRANVIECVCEPEKDREIGRAPPPCCERSNQLILQNFLPPKAWNGEQLI